MKWQSSLRLALRAGYNSSPTESVQVGERNQLKMKKTVLLVLVVGLLTCDATDPLDNYHITKLEGMWQLTAVLADPGDGSGTYQPVSSQKTLTFCMDGTF